MNEPIHNEKNGYCSNCHFSIGNATYCSKCGQKNTDRRISIGAFFSVAISTVFNLESKFFQTIRDLFIPGKLTTEWFKGRRKPYFHPVRLFIVTALLLIAALSLFITDNKSFTSGDFEKAQQETYRKEFIKEIDNYRILYLKDKKAKTVLDSLAKTMSAGKINSGRKTMTDYGKKNNLPDFKDKSLEEIIAYYENELGHGLTDSIINVVKSKRQLTKDSIKLANLIGDGLRIYISNEDFLNLNPAEIADKYQVEGFFNRLHFKQRLRIQKSENSLLPFVLGNSLWVVLLMMPFLAIILKLLYIRLDYYYLEHLIFLDYAGFRTLDSVVRAKEIFGQTKFTIISQLFHNERALYLAHKNNLDAIAFNAKDYSGNLAKKVKVREKMAKVKAMLDVNLLATQPKYLGDKIEIK